MRYIAISLWICVASVVAKNSDSNKIPETLNHHKGTKIDKGELSRESKFLPLVQFVSFENSPCISKSGVVGTCYSKSECNEYHGEASGDCAKGYGVCCIVTETCNSIITINNTYFQNQGFPSGYSRPGICSVEIRPPEGTVQLKLEFDSFSLLNPVDGDCGNDTFIATGVNSGSTLPVLCGENSLQHAFLEVSNAREPVKLTFSTTNVDFERRWNIKISFLSDYDACKAPPRCLQYYTDITGLITSFNYRGSPNMMLNDQGYAICFGYNSAYCNIGLNFPNLDLGQRSFNDCANEDYLAIAGEKICGTQTGLQEQINVTGPAIINVVSDEDNSDQQEGFMLNYNYLPCTD